MQIINIHQAKTNLSKILANLSDGDEVILGKFGKPVAKIVPYAPIKKARKPGILKGKISVSPGFTKESTEVNNLFYTET